MVASVSEELVGFIFRVHENLKSQIVTIKIVGVV
jgi:hypothetical protein